MPSSVQVGEDVECGAIGLPLYLAAIARIRGDLVTAEKQALAALSLNAERSSQRSSSLAMLAHIALLGGKSAEALEFAAEATRLMEELGGLDEGESRVRLIHAMALEAVGERDQARAKIAAARDRLLERAEKIDRPQWRRSFLENVPEHARTFELAELWSA